VHRPVRAAGVRGAGRRRAPSLASGAPRPASEIVRTRVDPVGFAARGWLGQTLLVLTKARVVAVRMRSPEHADGHEGEPERFGYPGFADDVARLF